jgi:hypothetical protein
MIHCELAAHVATGSLNRPERAVVYRACDIAPGLGAFVTGLLGPLLADPGVLLVRGFYARIRTEADGSVSSEGGRVTELVARPLLSLWWPELAGVVQPLAGEWAARRHLMESLAIPVGYGVELAALLDTASRHGLDALAQVDLGSRAHRHQANHDLAVMAAELLAVAETRRTGSGPRVSGFALEQYSREDGQVLRRSRPVPTDERPPARTACRRAAGRGLARHRRAEGDPRWRRAALVRRLRPRGPGQARWENSLRERASIDPRSPVLLLDNLLAPFRAGQKKTISQIPPRTATAPILSVG